jgi:hypothetical protein
MRRVTVPPRRKSCKHVEVASSVIESAMTCADVKGASWVSASCSLLVGSSTSSRRYFAVNGKGAVVDKIVGCS